MTPEQKQAICELGNLTRRGFDPSDLAGRHNVRYRQHLLELLTNRRPPQNQAGINRLREEFFKLTGTDGDCLAAQVANFRKLAERIADEIAGDIAYHALTGQ